MIESGLRRKIAWLIAIRAIIGTILLGSAIVTQITAPGSFAVDPFFFLIGLTYALTITYALTVRYVDDYRWLVDVQLAGDARHWRFRFAHLRGPRLSSRECARTAAGHERLHRLARPAMKRPPKPGVLLVAVREWRWLLRDPAAALLVFGVPVLAFAILVAVFTNPVIRGLNTVVIVVFPSSRSNAGIFVFGSSLSGLWTHRW